MQSPELDVATRAARVAAPILMDRFRAGLTFRSKAAGDLVSEADTESEKAIVACIADAFPDHAILAEENRRDAVDAEHLWVVDPLDGTNNFAHDIPHFAISIACYRDGQAQCAVVHNPARDDWYLAVRGHGATHNGRPARVNATDRLDASLVGVGFYYDRGAMMEATLAAMGDLFRGGIHGIRRFGTASLDLCHVATGLYGAYFEYELAPWDFAAARLIVEEAGGRVGTCLDSPLPLARTTILASNGVLHDPMLAIVTGYARDLAEPA